LYKDNSHAKKKMNFAVLRVRKLKNINAACRYKNNIKITGCLMFLDEDGGRFGTIRLYINNYNPIGSLLRNSAGDIEVYSN